MNKIMRVFVCLAVTSLTVLGFAQNLMAGSVGEGTITVGTGGGMTQAEVGLVRSTKVSSVSVRAISVVPTSSSSKDDYKYCKTQLFHHSIGNTPISKVYKLKEANDYSSIVIIDGYCDQKYFDLCFAGNNPEKAARIWYEYKGN